MMTLYIFVVIALFVLIIRMHILHKQEIQLLVNNHTAEILEQRADAIKRSKSVTRGQLSEHLIPLFQDFPYNSSELTFSGKPIDYLVFKGMDAIRDGKGGVVEIILADVKVGSAQRTKVQNAIKRAVDEGRVRWETWRIDENNKINIK